jgi:hypothetical protein
MPKEPREFQKIRYLLLAINDADRAYVRKWFLRWIAEDGKLLAPSSAPLYGGGAHYKPSDKIPPTG